MQVKEIFSAITNRKELEQLFKDAEAAGFNLGSSWDCHKQHLSAIVRRNNPFNMEVPRSLKDPKYELSDNYIEFEKKVKAHFDQLGVKDAIAEAANWVYAQSVYESYPRKKTREEVIQMGFTPHVNANEDSAGYAYNMSDPLKIGYKAEHFKFNRLLGLLGGPELPYYSDFSAPEISETETDDYKIFKSRVVKFKNLEFATKLREVVLAKLFTHTNALIKI